MDRARERMHDEQLTGVGVKHITATYSMKSGDLMISADSAGGAIDLTLPAMAEAVGKFYFVIAPSGATADVSVLVKETAEEIATYGDMDANDDHALFYCTGTAWITVFDGVA